MSSDLKAGILATVYATWLHNSLAIALFVGIGVMVFFLIKKPSRKYALLLIGFILLLIQFEYEKHFGKALEEQTLTSVLLQGGHLKTRSVIEDVFQKLIPFSMWVGGWVLVIIGALL